MSAGEVRSGRWYRLGAGARSCLDRRLHGGDGPDEAASHPRIAHRPARSMSPRRSSHPGSCRRGGRHLGRAHQAPPPAVVSSARRPGGRWRVRCRQTMPLTPREVDKLLLHVAADVARRRRERGVKLNYPESVALIADAMLEAARDGLSAAEVMALGRQVLTREEVMDEVPELVHVVQVEATFPDGTKLVSCHDPI